ncbi:MAG: hypothetical protein KF841_14130 [Phycisphaerae bacterium]|nr:hypothetical protein [Phycisphaerae bacterium]
MSIIVPTSTGKLRRTAAGKMRAGCCCGPPCEHCGDAPTPETLSLEFSGVTVAACTYAPFPSFPPKICHYNEVDDSLDMTVIVQRCPGCDGEDFVPCCWIGNSGVNARHKCLATAPPSDPPDWFPLYAIVYPFAVVGGQQIFAVYLGYLDYVEGQCDPPLFPTSDFVAFFAQFNSVTQLFCEEEVNENNEVLTPYTCSLGSQHIAYGGSVAINPL